MLELFVMGPAFPSLAGLLLLLLLADLIPGRSPRGLKAAILWAGLATAVIEVLSLARALTLPNLALSWWVIDLILTGAVFYFFRKGSLRLSTLPLLPARENGLESRGHDRHKLPFPGWLTALLVVGALLLVGIFIVGFFSIPSNGDAMTYHMSRIEYWLQHMSVAHYPTANERQLHSSPGAEFLILTLGGVGSGDYLAFLPQWLGLLGCAGILWQITRELGGDRIAGASAALLAISLQGAVLEGASTLNELVLAFWWCGAALLLLRLWRQPSFLLGGWLGGALGLAVLTKGSSYFIGLPLCLALGLLIILRRRLDLLRPLAFAALLVVALNAGHYARNFSLYRNPLGLADLGQPGTSYTVGSFSPRYLLSNALKHAYLHAQTNWGPVNIFSFSVLLRIHDFLGADVNSPHTRWMVTKIEPAHSSYFEERVGNTPHALLIVVTAAWLILSRVRTPARVYGLIALVVTLFMMAFLRWAPSSPRLHVPYFMFWMPMIALFLQHFNFPGLRQTILAVVLGLAFLPLHFGHPRSLTGANSIFRVPRERQPYGTRPQFAADYIAATNFLIRSQPRQIGFFSDGDDYEYPILRAVRRASPQPVRFEHLTPSSPSDRLATSDYYGDFRPEAAVAIHPKNAASSLTWKNNDYVRAFHRPWISVYLPRNPGSESP